MLQVAQPHGQLAPASQVQVLIPGQNVKFIANNLMASAIEILA